MNSISSTMIQVLGVALLLFAANFVVGYVCKRWEISSASFSTEMRGRKKLFQQIALPVSVTAFLWILYGDAKTIPFAGIFSGVGIAAMGIFLGNFMARCLKPNPG